MNLERHLNNLVATAEQQKPVERPGEDAIIEAMNRLVLLGYQADRCPGAFRRVAEWCAASRLKMARRGLLLYDETGLGKTYFFQVARPKVRLRVARRIVEAWEEMEWSTGFDVFVHGFFYPASGRADEVVIDDLGAERLGVRFGAREDVIAKVIFDRHEIWREKGVMTHFTTNLDVETLQRRYDDRIMRRLREMCAFVRFKKHQN
jgi:hypothetical protein